MTKNRVTNMTDDEAKLMFDLVLRKAIADKSTILEYDTFNHALITNIKVEYPVSYISLRLLDETLG